MSAAFHAYFYSGSDCNFSRQTCPKQCLEVFILLLLS